MGYNHTQRGYLIIYIAIALALFFGIILTLAGFNFIILVLMVFILLILISFASLNVKIDKKYIHIKFGYGIFRKRFPLKKIASVKKVRNHWYYGWGIRLWLWPRMWIFNVSGFDAVEIKMKDCRLYRIGTDEPEKLKRAITSL